jgi:hypothetical protein
LTTRRLIPAALCLLALSALAADRVLVLHGDGRYEELPASATQPATPPVVTPAEPPPVPPVVVPPQLPAMELIGVGKPGVLIDGKGGPVTVSGRWLRADGRDPSVAGFNPDKIQATGPDGLTVRNAASVTIAGVTVEKFSQNVVLDGISGAAIVSGLRTCDSWELNRLGQYHGQGLYRDHSPGTLTVADSLFAGNGYQAGLAPHNLDAYGQSLYDQFGNGPATVRNCVFVNPANAGAQLRSAGSFDTCVFVNCGTGAIVFGAQASFTNCVWVGGHYYFDGTNWTGNQGLLSCATLVTVRDCDFVGVPAQVNSYKPAFDAGEKCYPTSAICLSAFHVWQGIERASPAPQIDARNVRLFGWPGKAFDVTRRGNPQWNSNPATRYPAAMLGVVVYPDPVAVDVPDLERRARAGEPAASLIASVRATLPN